MKKMNITYYLQGKFYVRCENEKDCCIEEKYRNIILKLQTPLFLGIVTHITFETNNFITYMHIQFDSRNG